VSGIGTRPAVTLRPGTVATTAPVRADTDGAVAARLSLGAAPALAPLAAAGLVLVAVADNAARRGDAGLRPLIWAGLVLIYAPVALRLLGRSATRNERIALLVTLGLSLFLVYVLRSPAEFVRFDEFAWWRATHDIVTSGHAFNGNPLPGATSVYPALSTVTAGVSQLTGLSIFHSALITIGIARTVLVLALFLFLERVIGSSRAASIGIAVYVCNPSFVYFDAQFSYESLALMSAAAVLLVTLRWSLGLASAPASARAGLIVTMLLLIGGLSLAHHMTSVAVLVFLLIWLAVAARTLRSSRLARDRDRVNGPLLPTLLLAVTTGIWLGLVAAPASATELGGTFSRAFHSVADLIAGNSTSKQLFSGAGQAEGLVGRALIVGSVILMLIVLAAGLREVRRGRLRLETLMLARGRRSGPALATQHARLRERLWWTLGAVAVAYPVTLGLRLTLASSEISERASGFVFVGVAFLACLLVARSRRAPPRVLPRSGAALAVAVALTASFIGGFLLGELHATRQPGPYLVGAEERSITPQGVAAADFASARLPAKGRVLTDRSTASLVGSYGGMDPIFGRFAGTSLPRILFSESFDAADLRALRGQSLAFIVVDHRLSRETPLVGYYVESDEPGAFVRKTPVSAGSLDKFSAVAGLSKIYSNGPIDIYDARQLLR
jgi:hypothetical protein